MSRGAGREAPQRESFVVRRLSVSCSHDNAPDGSGRNWFASYARESGDQSDVNTSVCAAMAWSPRVGSSPRSRRPRFRRGRLANDAAIELLDARLLLISWPTARMRALPRSALLLTGPEETWIRMKRVSGQAALAELSAVDG